MKPKILYSSITLMLVGLVHVANATNRMERLSWTDRSLSNPPLAQTSSLDSTIENFWNVTLAEESDVRSPSGVKNQSTRNTSSGSAHKVEVKQGRNTREQRGYFGINLFNAIPLIDFVHGNVTTDNSDHVTGRR